MVLFFLTPALKADVIAHGSFFQRSYHRTYDLMIPFPRSLFCALPRSVENLPFPPFSYCVPLYISDSVSFFKGSVLCCRNALSSLSFSFTRFQGSNGSIPAFVEPSSSSFAQTSIIGTCPRWTLYPVTPSNFLPLPEPRTSPVTKKHVLNFFPLRFLLASPDPSLF